MWPLLNYVFHQPYLWLLAADAVVSITLMIKWLEHDERVSRLIISVAIGYVFELILFDFMHPRGIMLVFVYACAILAGGISYQRLPEPVPDEERHLARRGFWWTRQQLAGWAAFATFLAIATGAAWKMPNSASHFFQGVSAAMSDESEQ